MTFLVQLAISYLIAIVVGTMFLTRGGDGLLTIASIYGLVGLPFGLVAGALSRLFEKIIGLPGSALALTLIVVASYWLAPDKQNAWMAAPMLIPYVAVFVAAWTYMSWKYRGI